MNFAQRVAAPEPPLGVEPIEFAVFPSRQQPVEQLAAIAKVPVEAALADAEVAGKTSMRTDSIPCSERRF